MVTDEEISKFVKTKGIACGGNWTQMLMVTIKDNFPEHWAEMSPDHEWTFFELWDELRQLLSK